MDNKWNSHNLKLTKKNIFFNISGHNELNPKHSETNEI